MKSILSPVLFGTLATLALVSNEKNTFGDEPAKVINSAVYVRVFLPVSHPYWKRNAEKKGKHNAAKRAVETWVNNKSLQFSQTKVQAVTGWVRLAEKEKDSFVLWSGWGCPVTCWAERRKDGKIKVELQGWCPNNPTIKGQTVSSDIGSHGVAIVDVGATKNDYAYVGIVVAPSRLRTATEYQK